ncbi:MAG: 50S ribosomal protein L9 [Phycisphaerales bacterium]|jgi:large subunit ribosomal protein L9|nr:50S ribosomal protein L9 [Phycisphaerales bacterium]MBT7170790.1 50S ribosomal protein L9 [Phycisphaerales bacterium]
MKVLLKQNVYKLGIIGDIVDVKSGYARNYLLPQHLAIAPTAENVQEVEAAKAAYLAQVAEERKSLEARLSTIEGKEATIVARANDDGNLFGSVTATMISDAFEEEGVVIKPEEIILAEPIRQVDRYDVRVVFGEDLEATVVVWVAPLKVDGFMDSAEDAPAKEAPAADAPKEETFRVPDEMDDM